MRIGRLRHLWVWVWLAVAGCASTAPGVGGRANDPLLTSLQVTNAADRITLLLQVTNTSDDPLELTFPSGQRADFTVARSGETVWTWSADKSFIQALQHEVVAPGESRSFNAEWVPPARMAGEFTATGWLTARGQEAQQSARFTLP